GRGEALVGRFARRSVERRPARPVIMGPMDDERGSAKRDRLARMPRIPALLNAHPDGMRPAEIAHRVDSSVRTVYRDLRSIEGELGMPLWSDAGRWGVDA